MKEENKELLIKYIVCFGVASLITLIVFWIKGFFAHSIGVNIQILSDGFCVSGIMLLLFAGLLAVGFGALPIKRAYKSGVFSSCSGLYYWLTILVVVMLQCITLMRPMLSPIGDRATPQGKQFFIQHFFKSLK